MPRALQDLVLDLLLDPDELVLRDGLEAPAVTPSAASLAWVLPSGSSRSRSAGWRPYVTIPLTAAGYVTDAEAGDGVERVVRTPTLAASRLRAWRGLEPLVDADADAGTSVTYRLRTDGGDLVWSAAEQAWVEAEEGDWTSGEDLEEHAEDLPGSVRRLSVLCRLSTTSSSAAPRVYGVRFAYAVAWRSAADDALLRALLPLLQAVRIDVEIEEESNGSVMTDFAAGGSADLVQEVLGVYDLDDDPDEEAPLPGALAGTVWTFEDAPPAHHLRYVVRVRPDIVVRRHPDAEELRALPAVYVFPAGDSARVRGGDPGVLGARTSNPRRIPRADAETVGLTLLLLGAWAQDVEALADALHSEVLGEGGHRVILSPESGLPVAIRSDSAILEAAETLATGVMQARGSWILTYSRPAARTLLPVDIVTSTSTSFGGPP